MALVETKDLSLSPKKVILLFLYSCVVSTFFSLSPFIPFFFFRWPALRLFDTSKLVPPFSFLFAKRLCERQRAAFFKWKREIFLFTLRRRRRRKKKTTRGGTEDLKPKLLWNLKTFLSLVFFIILSLSFKICKGKSPSLFL